MFHLSLITKSKQDIHVYFWLVSPNILVILAKSEITQNEDFSFIIIFYFFLFCSVSKYGLE